MVTHAMLLIASFLVIAIYLTIYLALRQKLPSSISATYYECNSKWLFSSVIATTAALALVPWLEYSGDWQFLAFFGAASMMFIAASPAFKDDFVGKVHSGAACVLVASVVAWIWLCFGTPWVFLGFAVLALIDRKHFVWWIEIGLLLNLYPVLFWIIFMS